MKFKTTINCGGCIAAVTPVLNGIKEITHWSVDTGNPEKILTIAAGPLLTAEEVIEKLDKAGYKAQQLA